MSTLSLAPDGLVEGYASLFHAADLGRDVVLPGAFRDTIRDRGAAQIRMLWQHDPSEPIGTWQSLVEDARGLHVRGRLATGSRRARDVAALVAAGAVDGLSIGFRTVRARRDHARGVCLLERIDLWEISIVTFPLLPSARVAQRAMQAAKSGASRHHAGRHAAPPAAMTALRSLASSLRQA